MSAAGLEMLDHRGEARHPPRRAVPAPPRRPLGAQAARPPERGAREPPNFLRGPGACEGGRLAAITTGENCLPSCPTTPIPVRPFGALAQKDAQSPAKKGARGPQGGGDAHVAWAFCNRSAEGDDLPMDLKSSTRRNLPPTGHVGGHLRDATPVHHSSPPVQDHANERFQSERPRAPLYTHTLHPEAQQGRSTQCPPRRGIPETHRTERKGWF